MMGYILKPKLITAVHWHVGMNLLTSHTLLLYSEVMNGSDLGMVLKLKAQRLTYGLYSGHFAGEDVGILERGACWIPRKVIPRKVMILNTKMGS